MTLYNRKALAPHTSATAEAVNAETTKIKAAVDALEQQVESLVAGTPLARHTWIAWADSADGTDNFSNVAAGNRAYIGFAFEKTSPTRSAFPEDYTWSRLRGVDGSDGIDGVDGTNGKWKEFVFKRALTTPLTPTGNGIPVGWSDEPPLGDDPLWMSVAFQELDGTLIGLWSDPVRIDGEDGVEGVAGYSQAIVNIYQRGASQPALPTVSCGYDFSTGILSGLSNGWSTDLPGGNDPVWVSSASAVSQGGPDTIAPSEWAEPVRLAENGLNQATVFLFKRTLTDDAPNPPSATVTYDFATGIAAGVDGGWTQSLPPLGGEYRWMISAAALSSSQTDTIASGQWSEPAILAENGDDGLDGANTAQVFVYRRAAAVPDLPSLSCTYVFDAKSITGLNNGWSDTIPSGTDPIYVTSATATSTGASDTILPGEWASPVILAENGLNGADGLNSAVVFLFHRTNTADAPAPPSTSATYTFASGALTGQDNGWSQSLPLSGGAYRWVITASALSVESTDVIGAGEWSAPTLLAEDGFDGAAGMNIARVLIFQRSSGVPDLPSSSCTYTFATSALSGLNNGWSTEVPGGSAPLYVSAASAISNGPTDAIGPGEWAAPTIMAQNGTGTGGADGINNVTVLLFQRTTTASPPTLPSGTVTYNFGTGVASGLNNGWTQSLPTSGGEYRWLTSATALSTSTSDTIGAGEWAAAALLAEDGDDGATGSPGANGSSLFTWRAYADSADGTVNFTTGTPGDRGYMGEAYNKTSATESTNPADYTWGPARARAGFELVPHANCIAGPDYIVKIGGTGGAWDAGAYSAEAYVGGAFATYLAPTPASGGVMVGLNTDPLADASYTSIDYALYAEAGGNLFAYENGTGYGPLGTFAAGDLLTVHYDGKRVRYYKNGTILRDIGAPAGLRLHLDSSLVNLLGSCRGIKFGPAGSAGNDGATGAPGTNGADGTTFYSWYAFADSSNGAINFTTGAPGDRTWQGVRHGNTSPTESTNPTDYTWSPYGGPTAYGLAAQSGGGFSGNKIMKVDTVGGWAASVNSTEAYYQGAQVKFRAIRDSAGRIGAFFVGLNTDPLATTADPASDNWQTLDHGIYCEGSGGATGNLYWSEGSTLSFIGPYNETTVLSIVYDNDRVRYYANDWMFREVYVGPNKLFYLDSCMAWDGPRALILDFGPSGRKGDQGAAGANGANGADGYNAIAYIQDSPTPPAPAHPNQLWLQPTFRQFWRWAGTWVPAQGTLAQYDQIVTGLIAANTVVASHFVDDQGVDIRAVVSNSLNVKRQSFTAGPITVAASDITGVLAVTPPINISGHKVIIRGQFDVQGYGPNFFYLSGGTVRLYRRVNGGGWTLLFDPAAYGLSSGAANGTGAWVSDINLFATTATPPFAGYVPEYIDFSPPAGSVEYGVNFQAYGPAQDPVSGADGISTHSPIRNIELFVEALFYK